MIRFACPCGRQLQARDEDAGRQAKCPLCDAVSVIPDGSPPTAPDAVQADRPARPRRDERDERPRRREGDRDHDLRPAGSSGKAIAALIFGLSAVFLIVTALPGILFAVLALRDIGRSEGRLRGTGMAVTGIVLSGLGVLLLLPLGLVYAVHRVRVASTRMQDTNSLKQLGLAMHNYHDANGRFPQSAAYQDADGRPLLSWRVAILPYIGEEQLYRRFRLNEPWNSPHNTALLPLMPKVYARPDDPGFATGMTHFQVFVGSGAAFEPRKLQEPPRVGSPVPGWSMFEFTDGMSNTILLATSLKPVPWTKPEDMHFTPKGPLPPLGGHLSEGDNAVLADGSSRFLTDDLPEATLRAFITRNGGEIVPPP
jgi:hypothetical protein